jgi:hypothetical protein
MGLKRHAAVPVVLPADLQPLGTRLADQPEDQPLDREECRTALWLAAGNVTRAAVLLRTSSARLGSFVRRDAYLGEERGKAAELAVDRAESVILEALDDDDIIRRDDAARFVLTHAGRQRGWSRDGGVPGINMSFQGGPGAAGAIQIRWQTAEEATPLKVIEHER